MQVIERIPFLRGLTIGWAMYGMVWIVLEGSLRAVVMMGVLSTAVSIGHIWKRRLAGEGVGEGVVCVDYGRIWAYVWLGQCHPNPHLHGCENRVACSWPRIFSGRNSVGDWANTVVDNDRVAVGIRCWFVGCRWNCN